MMNKYFVVYYKLITCDTLCQINKNQEVCDILLFILAGDDFHF